MRADIEGREDATDQLARLVLRLIDENSPCSQSLLFIGVSGGQSGSIRGQELICEALRKLRARGHVEFVQESIVITDAGWRSLYGLDPVDTATQARWLQWVSAAKVKAGAWLAEYLPRARSILAACFAQGLRTLNTLRPFALRALGSARRWQRQIPWSAYRLPLGGTLLVIIFAGGVFGLIWSQRTEQGPPGSQVAATEAAGAEEKVAADPVETASITPNTVEQPTRSIDEPIPGGEQASPTEAAPPQAEEVSPADPVVAAIRTKLNDSSLRSRANGNDLAALEAFYTAHGEAPVWLTDEGFSAKAKAIIAEIEKAADWGLPEGDFDLPDIGDVPGVPDSKAADEIKLDLAILQYARFARGGRLSPQRVSFILDQKPDLLDPKAVLTEIQAASEPDAYLRELNPKHEQFERLRQALIKAREASKAKGKKPESDALVQRLVVNMERWRWMPSALGSYYVWNNIPSFNVVVISDGKSVYTEKAVMGQYKYATPVFSANMQSIVFNPEWTVPDTIKREDLMPRLRAGGLFGSDTSVLSEHGLTVSYQGRPVDPDSIDWGRANIYQFTFTQAPGPTNVLGKLKFNFPNKHAIYMHDTVQPEFFNETVRSLSHGCIRVREPARLAQLLLARDKGWSADQVRALLAKGNNSIVDLNRAVPVHLTYFTAVVDEQGKVQTLGDIYGLDSRMAAALFDKGVKFSMPKADVEANAAPQQRQRGGRRDSFADMMDGLFGN
jgi:murein L,D-transpeptidase YcbB/YkuD